MAYYGTTYQQLLQAVENYYGAGSDQWLAFASGATAAEKAAILKQVPGVTQVVAPSGKVLGYELITDASVYTTEEAAAAGAAQIINSNALVANTTQLSVPANAAISAGDVTLTSGATKVATGASAATIASHVATALVGAGIGLKLGVWIDGAFYNAYSQFWDPSGLEHYNPETWKDTKIGNFLVDNSGYGTFMAMMDKDGNTYIDENVFAMYAGYMYQNGMFAETASENDLPDDYYGLPETVPDEIHYIENPVIIVDAGAQADIRYRELRVKEGANVRFAYVDCLVNNDFLFTSDQPFVIGEYNQGTGELINDFMIGSEFTVDGHTFYVGSTSWGAPVLNVPKQLFSGAHWNDLMTLMQLGHTREGKEGVHVYGLTPDLEGLISIDDIIAALKVQYPGLFDNELRQGVLEDDGTITDHFYIPFTMPSGGTDTQPESKPKDETEPDTDENQKTRKVGASTPTPEPGQPPIDDDIGKGTTPPVVVPTGSASALYKIYRPTLTEVNSFGAWLWSPSFVDQLLKMFNDPMQAIISLHKIYASPHIGGRSNIKVGYLDSGVASDWVDEQYITVDCGEILVSEKYGNVFDYDTVISLYLPFCGIVKLNTSDIMRGRVKVIYHVDVITGVVLVDVKVTRDAQAGGIIYQYSGNMAEQYPLSSGSYMGIVGGILGIAGGIAGTIATGGAAAPMLLGAGAAALNMHTSVERANGFSGNAGAMGCKKPYLILESPITARTANDQMFVGYPANVYMTVDAASGFTRAKEIYVDNIPEATNEEKARIRELFRGGVVV